MKIGIITFHWGTNYGAVLQAYALQTYLSQQGYEAQIIDYVPRTLEKYMVKCLITGFITKRPWKIPQNVLSCLKEWRFYVKEWRLKKFRNSYLHLSRKYQSFEELKMSPPLYEVYICGSDQIWNPSFTAGGEGKTTLSYFLDFGPFSVKRIAYAVSFGCLHYPKYLLEIVSPILSKFDAVSVRENSGCQLVHKMGIDKVWLMPDPTLLLRAQDYECLLLPSRKAQRSYCFFYTLHPNQKTIEEIKNYFTHRLNRYIVDTKSPGNSMIGIENWLAFIKSTDVMITNSFHGMIFSIIFRKPFIVVPVEGDLADMNDRLFTLLKKIGLENRIIEYYEEDRINAILADNIDWNDVESRINSLRLDARHFFEKNLESGSYAK